MKVFLFVSLPKIGSVFMSYKFMFIVGNLIVGVLIGESKVFSYSNPSSASDHEYINMSQSLQSSSTTEVKEEGTTMKSVEENEKRSTSKDGEDIKEIILSEENKDLDEIYDFALPAEELSKRADDFIARVNEQRRLEAIAFSSIVMNRG